MITIRKMKKEISKNLNKLILLKQKKEVIQSLQDKLEAESYIDKAADEKYRGLINEKNKVYRKIKKIEEWFADEKYNRRIKWD